MMDWLEVLAHTSFKDEAECLSRRLHSAGIETLAQAQNAPLLGHICGVDIYQLVQEINRVFIEGIEDGYS